MSTRVDLRWEEELGRASAGREAPVLSAHLYAGLVGEPVAWVRRSSGGAQYHVASYLPAFRSPKRTLPLAEARAHCEGEVRAWLSLALGEEVDPVRRDAADRSRRLELLQEARDLALEAVVRVASDLAVSAGEHDGAAAARQAASALCDARRGAA